jgi:hypothetical protein
VGHPKADKSILKMLNNVDTIESTDLNAIITGPNKGRFPAGTYRANATEPDRDRPFRELTVVYHDELQDVQALPQFEDPILSHTLHSVEDKFAINYGVAGVGAEILANRLGVGPMFNCAECKFEEVFPFIVDHWRPRTDRRRARQHHGRQWQLDLRVCRANSRPIST